MSLMNVKFGVSLLANMKFVMKYRALYLYPTVVAYQGTPIGKQTVSNGYCQFLPDQAGTARLGEKV